MRASRDSAHRFHNGLDLGRQFFLQCGQLLVQCADVFGVAPQAVVDRLLEGVCAGHLRA
jgi:hypothetical protein